MRLEGWERAPRLTPMLRDAVLRTAPQHEVFCVGRYRHAAAIASASRAEVVRQSAAYSADVPNASVRG